MYKTLIIFLHFWLHTHTGNLIIIIIIIFPLLFWWLKPFKITSFSKKIDL